MSLHAIAQQKLTIVQRRAWSVNSPPTKGSHTTTENPFHNGWKRDAITVDQPL